MNIIVISHERSLNKAEGILNLYKTENVYLVVDALPDEIKKPYVKLAKKL